MRHALSVMVTLLALAGGDAMAGVVVTSTSMQLDTRQASPMMVYADADKLKVVTADTTIIFRGDQKKVWIINAGQKNYVEMTPETMQRLGGQLAGAQAQLGAANAQLQQQLAGLPPAQRAQIEAMMAARGGGAGGPPGGPPGRGGAGGPPPAPQVSYAKAGPNKTVANMRCDMYRKTVNGAQEEDVCIAQIAAARLTPGDFRVLEDFSTFIEPIASAPQVPRSDYMNWNAMNRAIGFQGMPVDTVHYVNGSPSRQDTVQKVERVNIPAGTFELPPGLTPRTFGPPGSPR